MLGNLARQFDRAALRPESLPGDLVTAVALVPPILAGLLLFRLPALELLALAVVAGGLVHLLVRALRQPLLTSPILPAVVGVGLCGPASPLVWALAVAGLTCVFEVVRGRVGSRAGIHTGVLAYSVLFLASGGAMAAYLKPAGLVPFPEPIQQWSRFYGGAAHFLEPSTLYVGNVAGPVFTTSLLAVAISIAWLWYARRLSLSALVGFLVGGTAISIAMHWDPVFQLDSGPAWFVVGFALADGALLPKEPYGRTLLGLAAGAIGVGLRSGPFYVEGLFLTVASIQLLYLGAETTVRLLAPRLRPRPGLGLPDRKEPASA